MFRIPGLKTIHQSKSYGDDAIYEYRGVKIIGSTARGAYGRHAIYCVKGIPIRAVHSDEGRLRARRLGR
jgi:hypothetical protein